MSSANLMKRLELCDGVQSWVSRVNCDQDAPFPVPNYSDPTIWIGDLDPSEDGNQQTGDLSNAMPNCTSTMRQSAHDQRGDTEKTLTVVPNGHFSTAIQTTFGANDDQRGKYATMRRRRPGRNKSKTALRIVVSHS